MQCEEFDPIKPQYQVVSLESNTDIERKKALLLAVPAHPKSSDNATNPSEAAEEESGMKS